ncbi:MAG: YidC/Oxa1 family membrane protein insertase [Dehalococcoidia bacterium]
MPIGYIWQTFLETPLINFMVVLTVAAFGSYGMAILIFTVLARALMFPLTLRMLNSMRGLQEIQPQMQEIQKKYSDPRRRSEEMMKLYREAGVNPLGCVGPQLLQFPIFIALFQVIRITLGTTPENVLTLSHRLYDVPFIQDAIPLRHTFLWMDLSANGDIILVAVVFASMWLQTRISTNRASLAASEQQRQMNSMMQWMMPAMFSWFVLITPAGVGLYWASSTVIGIVLQWIFVGPGDFTWGSLVPNAARRRIGMPPMGPPRPARQPRRAQPASSEQPEAPVGGPTESRDDDDHAGTSNGNQRTNRRRSNRARSESTRPAPRSGRRRRHHRG